jgi:inner membrane transporter RhtA
MLSFQAGASIAKQLIPAVGAPGTTALRLGLSAVLVAVLQRPWRHVPSRAAWPVVLAYGLALGTMNFVFYLAIRTIPLGIAVALEFTGPLAVAVVHSRRRLDYVWIALAVIGLVLLLQPIALDGPAEAGHYVGANQGGADAGHLDPAGVLFALAAGVCWAAYIVFGQRAARAHGAGASAWGMLIAACAIVPIGARDAGRALLSPAVLPLGAGVAVLSSALPYTLEMIALRDLSARTYGILMSVEPALAALVGLVVLGETLTASQWLAIAAVVVASIGTVATVQGPPHGGPAAGEPAPADVFG